MVGDWDTFGKLRITGWNEIIDSLNANAEVLKLYEQSF